MTESAPAAARRLRVLSANIQAGSSTRRYSDYVTRSWSHALPAGNKRGSLDAIAQLAGQHDIVGLQEADPGSLRSGFLNQTRYLAEVIANDMIILDGRRVGPPQAQDDEAPQPIAAPSAPATRAAATRSRAEAPAVATARVAALPRGKSTFEEEDLPF